MDFLTNRDPVSKATASLPRWGLRIVLTLAAAITLTTGAAAQTPPPAMPQGNYTITDLGVLTTQNDTDSNALAINNSGSVVGYSGVFDESLDSLLVEHAFLWTPSSTDPTTGRMIYLLGLPGTICNVLPYTDTFTGIYNPGGLSQNDTEADDINSSGQVVGFSWATGDGICNDGTNHGFLYNPDGSYRDFGLPLGVTLLPPIDNHPRVPASASFASTINDAGQIAGWEYGSFTGYEGDPGPGPVWLYDGSFHDLGPIPFGQESAFPSKINNNEITVGTYNLLGFAHKGGGPINQTDLIGTLGGATSDATGINDAGMIVGGADTVAGSSHAYLRDQFGNMKDLGTLSADFYNSEAHAINNSGHDVVGESDVDITSSPAYFQSLYHAVIWPSGGPAADLNLLLDPSLVVSDSCAICWELISANGINDRGQIVGEGFYHGQRHAFLLTPKCMNDGGDTDGDGLCDNWEKYGYTDKNSGQFINLPAMGADPMHKDIFVQADYMVDSGPGTCGYMVGCTYGHTHKPTPAAMAMVIQAFANAPVENPDGTTGIDIHIDCGPDCIMNPLTGETWGMNSQALAIEPEITPLGSESCRPAPIGCDYDFTPFNDLMSVNFTPTGRAASFHYMIFAHSIGATNGVAGGPQSDGISAFGPNSTFIVGLGNEAGQVGTTMEQAGVFMHELGHNLGLNHGGLDGVNLKPNYLSIMNYSFTAIGLIQNGTAGHLDYSRFPGIPALDEYSLNEQIGLNGGPLVANYGTIYWCFPQEFGGKNLVPTAPFVLNANGPIDWNCDGTIETSLITAGLDINGALDSDNAQIFTHDPLTSSEDWSHLVFAGGAIGGLFVLPAPPSSVPSSLERALPHLPTPNQVQVVSPGLARVLPGGSLNLTYTISNTGTQSDTFSLTPVSQYDWWSTSSVPSTVTLAAGTSQQVPIPVTVPSSFGCVSGIRATFTLQVVSQTYATLTDSGVAELDLVSVPGSSTVPAVSGLTKSEAQAAIVSAGFVPGAVTLQFSSTVPTGTVISQTPLACGFAASGSAISLVVSTGPQLVVTPNVVGDTQAQASSAVTTAGLTVGTITTTPSLTVTAGNVISETPAAGTTILAGSPVVLLVSSGAGSSATVPNVVGQPLGTATNAIGDAGLALGTVTGSVSSTVAAGIVLSESPTAGTSAALGSSVNLTVSVGSSVYSVVPNIVGDTQAQALSAITAAGLFFGGLAKNSSTTVPAGQVISQNPLPGLFEFAGSLVYFAVSAGPQPNTVPNVYGLPQAAAKSAITAMGLTVGTITAYPMSTPPGTVFSQNPIPGTYATAGSPVSLQVSSGLPQYTVPDLSTTNSIIGASDILAAGLTLGTFTAELSSTLPYTYVISQSPAAGTAVAPGSPVNVVYSAGSHLYPVPTVAGESQYLATSDVLHAFFFVAVTRQPSTTVPDGVVISQSPAGGGQALLDTIITLVVSSGGPVVAAIPNVVGIEREFAENQIFAAGFAIGSVTNQPSLSVPPNYVISQSPAAGTSASWDTSVTLVYSSGPPLPVVVPNIAGDTQAAAIAALNAASLSWALTTQSSQTVAAGNVISQNPAAGASLLGVGVPVSFVVSAGATIVPNYSYSSQFGEPGGGTAASLDGQFVGAYGLAVDPASGNIIVAGQDGRIQIFDCNGNFKSYFGGYGLHQVSYEPTGQIFDLEGPAGNGLFSYGQNAIAVDPVSHNIVAVDVAGQRVLIFNSAGVFQSEFGSPGPGPGQFEFSTLGQGVAIDPVTENILVSDFGNNRIQVFNSAGVYQSQFGTGGGGDGQFSGTAGLAIDPASRNIAVADWGNARVQIFNSAGGYLNQFGGPGFENGTFYEPTTVAIDPSSHNILVGAAGIAGYPQPFLQIFTSAGVYLTQFGGFGTGNGQTHGGPPGIAFDPVCHNIVVVDPDEGRVEIFGAAPVPAATTTTLVASSNPATFGQSVTFTATVTGDPPTGAVQFLDGAHSLGAPVSLTAGVATLTTSTLAVGTHSITADYSGDAANMASTSAALSEVISPYPATTTLKSSTNPAIAGQSVTFTATVAGSGPTGTVQFLKGNASLGAPVALAAGMAALTTSTLPAGTNSIAAVYSGDGSNATSTSAVLKEIVSLAPTTTAVLSSADHATLGQSVTFSGVVTGDSPTGVVQFLDGASSLGAPVALTGNVATLAISTLALGTHSITAVYKGDAFNAASTSPVLSEFVSLNAPTTTSLVASVNPVITGHSVTFTAKVTGNSPSGFVQFMDGVAALGSPVALTGGAAALTTSALPIGTHLITAVYNGDASNGPSTSAVVSEVVLRNATTTVVTTSVNPANVSQLITFTAAVAGGSPTGPIQFMDGSATLLKPVVLSNGQASLTLAYSSAGKHAISAVYSGDGFNETSTSAILNQVVSAEAPVVTAPAAISIPATQAGGATSSASQALAAFLAGATAVESISPAPVQLPPQVGGVAVSSTTLFPVGTTTVTFSFKDSNGNVGSATSTVTVAVGTPRITGSTAGIGTDPSGAIYVNVVLTNTGTGNARNLTINTLTFRTLSGTGTATYNTTLSPALPLVIGNLDVGNSVTTKMYLNVPSTATRISITESGPVQDVLGTKYNYSTAEAVIP